MIPRSAYLPTILIISLLGACSAGTDSADADQPMGNGAPSSSSSDDAPPITIGADGPAVELGPTGGSVDETDTRDLEVRQQVCDESGLHCTCLRLALLGTLESAANQKNTQPFINWLNDNSGGSAVATLVDTKPTLTDEYLAGFDILIVANINGWTFSADEKAAVARWVRETGGGIVNLTGFVSQGSEPAATSQLIEFSGLKYTGSETALEGAGQSLPIYYADGTENLRDCIWWNGGDTTDAGITTPIRFTPQAGNLGKLTYALNYVGAFKGFGVEAPEESVVVASDPTTSQDMAVALEVEGAGRIFAFGDEWVIFANQWAPTGSPPNQQQDQYNKCWLPDEGIFHSVATLYQTKQFWYNAINWVAPPNECGFVIEDVDVDIWAY